MPIDEHRKLSSQLATLFKRGNGLSPLVDAFLKAIGFIERVTTSGIRTKTKRLVGRSVGGQRGFRCDVSYQKLQAGSRPPQILPLVCMYTLIRHLVYRAPACCVRRLSAQVDSKVLWSSQTAERTCFQGPGTHRGQTLQRGF